MSTSRLVLRLLFVGAFAAGGCGGHSSRDLVPELPGDGTANTAAPTAPGTRGQEAGDDPWAGGALEPPEPTTPAAAQLPNIERFTLGNGLPVVLVRTPGAYAVSVQLAVTAGGRHVPARGAALPSFVAAMLTRGTKTRSTAQLAEVVEASGANLRAGASYEATLVRCTGALSALGDCLTLVTDAVANPTFPAAEIGAVRANLVAEARRRRADPSRLAGLHFQHLLWGDKHPRGGVVGASGLAEVSRNELVTWHRQWFRPNNAALVIQADTTVAALKTRLTRAVRGWSRRAVPKPPTARAKPRQGITVRLVDRPGDVAHVRVGHYGVRHSEKDFFATRVVNRVLGEGIDSRLARAVKGGATSSFDRSADRGAFVIGGAMRGDEAVVAAQAMMREMIRMAQSGPSEVELRGAVSQLAGEYAVRMESQSAIADGVLAALLHGFGDDYVRDYALAISKVDVAAAQKAAAAHLSGQNLVVAIVGPAGTIEPKLKQAGWKYEKTTSAAPIGAAETIALSQDDKVARGILNKALAAKGGFDRLSRVKTFVWAGEAVLRVNGQEAPAKVKKQFVAPDKLRLDMEVGRGQYVATTVFSGKTGWARQAQGKQAEVVDLPPAELQAGLGQLWRDMDFVLLRHRKKGVVTKKLADSTAAGKPEFAVAVRDTASGREVVLLIDKSTYLLSGMSYTEQGVHVEERYRGYKKVDGIQVAHDRLTKSVQLDLTTKMTSASFDGKVDPNAFSRPAK